MLNLISLVASLLTPAQSGITVSIDDPATPTLRYDLRGFSPRVASERSRYGWRLPPLTHDQWIIAASGWCEGRSGGQAMIQATVNVLHNRAVRHRTTVAVEALRPWQLSCWNADTRHAMYGIGRWISPRSPDGIAWIVARGVAIRETHGNLSDVTHGALFYHTRAAHPTWDRRMRHVATIGAHLFYR